jgi:predicted transcriptional regulator
MTAKRQRIHRPNPKTPEQRAKEKAIQERFQREKPTLEELIASGEYKGPISLGMYFTLAEMATRLKERRVKLGLSLADVSRIAGMDRGFISRLETCSDGNPTISTIERYAKALGATLAISLIDDPSTPMKTS